MLAIQKSSNVADNFLNHSQPQPESKPTQMSLVPTIESPLSACSSGLQNPVL
jgi:hypothetical protein